MPITVVLHGQQRPSGPSERAVRRITFDAPRIVFGRGEGCEVRLPDTSVSHRHASLRQRGLEWVLVDEGSTNGTRVGRERLGVQAPKRLRARELIRIGKQWVELVVATESATPGATAAAKEAAIDLVCEQLGAEGEDVRPRVRVVSGADAGGGEGGEVVVGDEPVILGRARDAALLSNEPEASRKHVSVRRAGDALVVRDLGSKAGTLLGDRPLGPNEAIWRVGTTLQIGGTTLEYSFEAVEALGEMERAPDDRCPSADLEVGSESAYFEASSFDDDLDDEAASESPVPGATTGTVPVSASAVVRLEDDERPTRGRPARQGWGVTDLAVVVLALGVFSLSAVGYLVLLR